MGWEELAGQTVVIAGGGGVVGENLGKIERLQVVFWGGKELWCGSTVTG